MMTPMNELHDTLHRQVWDLIPWVAAGSASDADHDRVRQHLTGCDNCRQEMAFHQHLVQGMRADGAESAADANADTALQRLWARVDQGSPQTTPSVVPAPLLVNGKAATHHSRWLVAAVLLQSVGLAALAGLLLHNWRDVPYPTLSTSPTSAAVVQLRLVPAPTMPVGQLSALLSSHGLHVVESNHDGTVLGLALSAPVSTPNVLQALATQLRAEPGVLLAEPTAAGR
jgi:Putative zinc-finger